MNSQTGVYIALLNIVNGVNIVICKLLRISNKMVTPRQT